jgi:hypothetical protein
MHLKSLEISNLRVFRKANLNFDRISGEPLSNVSLFLGTNGCGKTSLLKAIAIAAVGGVLPSSGMRPYSLVRRTNTPSRLCTIDGAFSVGPDDVLARAFRSHVSFHRAGGFNDRFGDIIFPTKAVDQLWTDDSPSFFIVGYGATRRLPSSERSGSDSPHSKSRALRYQRIAGLFEDDVELVPIGAWLSKYRGNKRHAEVISIINRLLVDVDLHLVGDSKDGYLFESTGSHLPLEALSDGPRAFIGWVSDMLFHLSAVTPLRRRLSTMEGMVLVDEIDLHLHPRWQRGVIRALSACFPKLQFFFTSHSPLVAGSLPSSNIFLVSHGPEKAAVVQASDFDVYGWSVDQILNSPLFEKTPVRNEAAVAAIQSASVKAKTGDKAAAFELMRILTGGLPVAGRSIVKVRKVVSR